MWASGSSIRLRVAGGEQSEAEELGMGDNEFVPWQIDAVM